jgi:glycosyltransferase involved in cell wall biosynthesis
VYRAATAMTPRLSVIVRSYNRLPALCELLERLGRQDHPSFEVVVVDQSTRREPDAEARLGALLRDDPRIRLLRYPPLGGPRARNEGVRAARGELLVFIDDDDLPERDTWLSDHERNFADPACLGVTGRFMLEGGPEAANAAPYPNMERARKKLLSLSVLRWQWVYARADVKKRVDSAMGGNAAWRRSALERFGLWDECTPIEDEPSLCYRFRAEKRDGEYLLFDPDARMIRRYGVPGGMDKRRLSAPGYGAKLFLFFHNVVAHYYPLRFALLYPGYWYMMLREVYDWLFDASSAQRTPRERVAAAIGFTAALPFLWTWWLGKWWLRRLRHGPLPHRPTIEPTETTRAALAAEAEVRAQATARIADGGQAATS